MITRHSPRAVRISPFPAFGNLSELGKPDAAARGAWVSCDAIDAVGIESISLMTKDARAVFDRQ
jgi:hypothetical protein